GRGAPGGRSPRWRSGRLDYRALARGRAAAVRRGGEAERDGGAVGTALYLEPPARAPHDRLDQGAPRAQRAGGGREEGIEDARPPLGRDAAAAVRNHQLDLALDL